MSILSLTFRDLQYLVALADIKHFGKAAKYCHVSQPALSAQIKKIEGYFDKVLFERKNKQVIVTQEGLLLVERAREILQQAMSIDEEFKNNKETFSTPLYVGIIYTLSTYYPAKFIENLLKKYPHSALILKEGFTDELIAELKSGKIDALIASEVLQDERFEIHPLFKEPLEIIVNKKHPISSKKSVELSDLNANDMIFLKDGNCLRNEAIELCPKNKRGNIHEYYLNNIETLKYMVAMRNVYAIIPQMANHLDGVLKKFVSIKPIDDKKAYRQVSLYTRKHNPRHNDIQKFLAILNL